MPWRSRFAKRSSTRPGLLVGAVALGAVVSVIGLAIGSSALAFAGLAAAIVGASGFALHLIVTERRRHEYAEGELESLVESLGRIAESLDPDQVLERTLREAKDLFGAKASLLAREDTPRTDTAALVPLHIRHERIGALQLVPSSSMSVTCRTWWAPSPRDRTRSSSAPEIVSCRARIRSVITSDAV